MRCSRPKHLHPFAPALGGIALVLLLSACGDDPTPAPEIPSWAHVAPEQIAEAKKHGVPVAFENELGMRFVLIPAGTFMMGSPEDEEGRSDGETQHEVTISKPFYMSIYEVTNGQYRQHRASHVSDEKGLGAVLEADDRPVLEVSWDDAVCYGAWLSDRDSRRVYWLPTEAEWEYACRAATASRFFWGGDRTLAPSYANVGDQSALSFVERDDRHILASELDDDHALPAPVGSFRPNTWGLYDMIGNVFEWCRDWYGPYNDAAVLDPSGPASGTERVCRGGSWMSEARSSSRPRGRPASQTCVTGFRLVSPLPEPGER